MHKHIYIYISERWRGVDGGTKRDKERDKYGEKRETERGKMRHSQSERENPMERERE